MAVGSGCRKGPLDGIFQSLGVWGRWQTVQIGLVLSLQSVAVYQLLSIVFIGYEAPFSCNPGGNVTSDVKGDHNYNSSCGVVVSHFNGSYEITGCDGYHYSIPKRSSIVSEWDLVCGKKYFSSLSQTVLIGGQAFGATFFSYLSDRYGRKRIFLWVQWAMFVVSTVTVFAPDITVFTILRFFTGALQQGLVMLGVVLPLEITTIEHRALILLLTGVIWGLFNGSLAGLGYLFRALNWRYLQAVFSGVSLLLLVPNVIFVDESLRWLVANGKGREAQRILKKAAKMNRVRLSADDDLTIDFDSSPNIQDTHRDEDIDPIVSPSSDTDSNTVSVSFKTNTASHYTCCDVLANRRLRRFTLVMCFVWIVSSFGYFGLSLAASQLAGDRFLNFFLLAVADTPAAIVSFFTMKWFGRKPTCLIFNGLPAVCMVVTICLTILAKGTTASNVITAMAIIGKFGISASFGCLFIYTSELFPTTIRGVGCGLASSASRIGGMVAPFFTLFITTYPLLFPIVLGSGCCIVCLLVLFLPETRDKELPQTLEDIEDWFSTRPRSASGVKVTTESSVKLLSDYD